MNKRIIDVPEGIFYLANVPNLVDQLPQTSFIFNKIMTGCGATTLFLKDKVPTILCSPRKELIRCKANDKDFIGKVHLFGSTVKKHAPVIDKINAMKEYIDNIPVDPFNKENHYVPKILVTYDSFTHVYQGLLEKGIRDNFRIVVDEFQTIFTDASFRGDVEAQFMENITRIDHVIYLSATPYMEAYLDMLDNFKSLPYIELSWPASSIARTDIKHRRYYQGSPAKTIDRIIAKYRKLGYFEENMDGNGNPQYAREAVFFCNEVKFITKTIIRNNLSANEVNIICSEDDNNDQKLGKIGHSIGHAPKYGKPHKPFTFVTKASYEGTDFYSPSAYTYIFSNIHRENMAIDISIDVPQIMGRQRRSDNPFRMSATFFYKTLPDYSEEAEQEFVRLIEKKTQETNEMILDFYNADQKKRLRDARKYKNSQLVEKYKNDYLSVVEDSQTREPQFVFNKYVCVSEIRSVEVQKIQYRDGVNILNTINTAFKITDDESLTKFRLEFEGKNCFEERMKLYAEFLDIHPEYQEILLALVEIPMNIKQYYRTFGSGPLRVCSWKEADIQRISEQVQPENEFLAAIRSSFISGNWYSLKEVKGILQKQYDIYHPGWLAKGSDLPQYIECSMKLGLNAVGKRVNGYSIT